MSTLVDIDLVVLEKKMHENVKGLQLYIEHNGDYRQRTNFAQIDPLTLMSQLQVIKHQLTHKKYP